MPCSNTCNGDGWVVPIGSSSSAPPPPLVLHPQSSPRSAPGDLPSLASARHNKPCTLSRAQSVNGILPTYSYSYYLDPGPDGLVGSPTLSRTSRWLTPLLSPLLPRGITRNDLPNACPLPAIASILVVTDCTHRCLLVPRAEIFRPGLRPRRHLIISHPQGGLRYQPVMVARVSRDGFGLDWRWARYCLL